MGQTITDHGHDDMIHDAVLDYFGRRLATCSSDKTIRIFEVEGDTHRLVSTLSGHEGAVWAVSWAHPKFGSILASASYDGKVFIWRETAGQWTRIIDLALHTASVNTLSWAPHDLGALLACASSDGALSILEFRDSPAPAASPATANWSTSLVRAHDVGANAVSWAPTFIPGALEKAQGSGGATPQRRFASGGSDCLVKLWAFESASGTYEALCTLSGHADWVRDVAWSPSLLSKSYIASASQDKTVRIWTLSAGADASDASNWKASVLEFDCVVWRVSWSLSGNVLAVSGADNRISLWKERVRDGGWECVKTIEE